jgi:PLP dependent protein
MTNIDKGAVLKNLERVQEQISGAAKRSGRKASEVTLVLVTKTVPLETVQIVLEQGVIDIGESRVQEALTKFEGLRTSLATPPVMHLIGPLQSNKAKKAVGFFDVIQSLDSMDLARDINRHALALGKRQTCLIEIKISSEATKSGLAPELLSDFRAEVEKLEALEIRGLMGIPPLDATGEASRPYFRKLRQLFGKGDSEWDTLSMGMSSDFHVAIEEGATCVRVGSAVFKDSLSAQPN